jgi:hypothetical protein
MMPLGVEFIQETTIFREFGPLAGSTMRLAVDASPGFAGLLSRQTYDAELRHYLRLGGTGLLATRIRGFKSTGAYPDFLYFGGNGDLRGYDYLQFAGQNVVYANAELRFPIIEAALTPIGVVGGVRGVFFAGIGGAWFNNQPSQASDSCTSRGYTFATNSREICRPVGTSPRRWQWIGRRPAAADLRPGAGHQRFPAQGRTRLVRPRPRDVRARLPHPLRLVVADDVQPGVGEHRVRGQRSGGRHERKHVVPPAAVRDLDRIRLLIHRVIG